MKILLLEDDENRIKWFKMQFIGCDIDYAYTPEQAYKLCLDNLYDVMLLDHDLDDIHYELNKTFYEGTGKEFCDKLVESGCNKQAQIIIHSLNSAGAENMFQTLKRADYNVQKVTYLQLKAGTLRFI